MVITPGAFISAVSSTYKAVEFVLKLTNVPDESAATVKILLTVNTNLEELRRLRNQSRAELESRYRKELEEINQSIRDTTEEIYAVARPVEKSRADTVLYDGSVRWHHRITWVLRDAAAVKTHETALTTCNATILSWLTYLRQLDQQNTVRMYQASAATRSVENLAAASGNSTPLTPEEWISEESEPRARTRVREGSYTRERQVVNMDHLDNEHFWLDWLGDHFSRSNSSLLLPQDNESLEPTSSTSWLASHSRERSRDDRDRRNGGAEFQFL